jgi:hypothetical protein
MAPAQLRRPRGRARRRSRASGMTRPTTPLDRVNQRTSHGIVNARRIGIGNRYSQSQNGEKYHADTCPLFWDSLRPSSDSGRGDLTRSRIQNVPLIIIIVRDNPGAATVWTLAFVSRLFVENAFAIAFRTCLRLHCLPRAYSDDRGRAFRSITDRCSRRQHYWVMSLGARQ